MDFLSALVGWFLGRELDLGLKGADGMGDADGTGVLRFAQDDSKNKQQQNVQRQKQATARTEADPLRG
jgi:hypothetical protein